MGFIAGDSVLDAAYGYGMVCDVIRNPDETYPVICRFWQNGAACGNFVYAGRVQRRFRYDPFACPCGNRCREREARALVL